MSCSQPGFYFFATSTRGTWFKVPLADGKIYKFNVPNFDIPAAIANGLHTVMDTSAFESNFVAWLNTRALTDAEYAVLLAQFQYVLAHLKYENVTVEECTLANHTF